MEEKIRGILLSTIPYLDKSLILKVFTPFHGLITLMSNGLGRKVSAGCTVPFCEAEWVFWKGKGELYRLKEAALLESFSGLKGDFSILAAAGSIASDLLRSQLPSKKGDGLYSLVHSYLKKLPTFQYPEVLVASFRLKLLLWEGVLGLNEKCAVCGEKASALTSGESVCLKDATMGIPFEEEEWAQLFILAFARQFSALQKVVISAILKGKIEKIFEEKMK